MLPPAPNAWRAWARAAAIFSVVLFAGALTPQLERAFIWGYCAFANPLLTELDYAGAIQAKLSPAEPDLLRRKTDQVRTDSVLTLQARGYRGVAATGLSLRRDVYLPWLVTLALLAAAPLPRKRKLLGLGIATSTTLLVALASTCLLLDYLVVRQAPNAIDEPLFWSSLTDFAFERWLTPPGNRAIAPLLLAALLVAALSPVPKLIATRPSAA